MTYDFLIIGGGIAGISAAAHLAPLGSTCVLEAESALGYHATGRSAAMYLRDYGNDVVRVLNYASEDHHRTANGGVLSPRGLLSLARAQDEDAFGTDLGDLGMSEISLDDAVKMFPILNLETTTRAAYLAQAPDIDTDRLLQNYLKLARGHGGKIVCNARVSAIQKDGIWRIQAGGAEFEARILINAAGPWVDGVAQMAGAATLGFQAYRRSMARIPAPDGHDLRGWPMTHGTGDRWYAKPDAGAWMISPGEAEPMEPHDAWADDMVLAEGIARYQEMVTSEVTRLETSWAGLRTFAPDKTLVVGFDSVVDDFFWLGGQGGYGFQTAPAVAVLVGEILGGKATTLDADIVQALSPKRFTS